MYLPYGLCCWSRPKTFEKSTMKNIQIFSDTLLSEQRLQMESLWIEYLVEIQLSKEGLGFHRKCFQFSIYTQHCLQFPQNAVPSPKEGLPCQKILLWRRGALFSTLKISLNIAGIANAAQVTLWLKVIKISLNWPMTLRIKFGHKLMGKFWPILYPILKWKNGQNKPGNQQIWNMAKIAPKIDKFTK